MIGVRPPFEDAGKNGKTMAEDSIKKIVVDLQRQQNLQIG